VARIFDVDKDTVLSWLVAASAHAGTVLGYVIHELYLEQVQMDELYALLRDVSEKGRRKCWVWAAIDPISKLILAIEVGARSLEMAQRLVHSAASVLAPGVVPLFVTDQLAAYAKALLTHFGCWVEKTSEQSGRVLRRWMPDEQLRINTAFIERANRTLRAHVPGLGRREEGLVKNEPGLRRGGMLFVGYYNLCLPHTSLRDALPQPIPTKRKGLPKKRRQRTPAMAAGLTDHVGCVRGFLLFRVPPWRQEGMAA